LALTYHYLSFAAVPIIANDMSWKIVRDGLPTTLLEQIVVIIGKNDANIVVLFVEDLTDAAVGALISEVARLPVVLIHDGTTDFHKAAWFDEACSGNVVIVRTLEDVLALGREGFQAVIEALPGRSEAV